MKRYQIIGLGISTLIGVIFIAYAEVLSLAFFTARSEGEDIILEWRTITENQLSKFEIERKRANEEKFHKIGEVPAKGFAASYRFVDTDAFQKRALHSPTAQGAVYYYRLKAIRTNNRSPIYSEIITVTHTVSSFRRTWGMIKELFR